MAHHRRRHYTRRQRYNTYAAYIMGPILILALIRYCSIQLDPSHLVYPPAYSSDSFNGSKYEYVVRDFEKAFFTNITTHAEPDLDSMSDRRKGRVYKVEIGGETEWTEKKGIKKQYRRNSSVNIYYHEVSPTAKVYPPEGNSSFLIGQDYEQVKAKLEEIGFFNIETRGNNKLSASNPYINQITQVTINGDTEWSYGIGGMLRKTYPRNVKVVIYYNSEK